MSPYKDPAIKKARDKAYYAEHRAEKVAYYKAYHAAHREEKNAASRVYAAAHREELREKNKLYYAANREGHNSRCRTYYANQRESIKAYSRAYGKANRAKRTAADRSYWAEHREQQRSNGQKCYVHHREARMEHRVKAIYKISKNELDAIFENQHRSCAICGRSEIEGKQRHVDHDHTTGKIRGILCRRCNLTLGMLDDDAALARAMISYLEKHKPGEHNVHPEMAANLQM